MMNGLLVLEIIDSSVNDLYTVALLQFCKANLMSSKLCILYHLYLIKYLIFSGHFPSRKLGFGVLR